MLGDELLVGRHLWLDASGNYETPNFVAHATISTTTVTGYRRKGMLIDGPGTTALVVASVINGGAPSTTFVPEGIQISRGATGNLEGNLIESNEYIGTVPFFEEVGVTVQGGCADSPTGGPLSTNVKIVGNLFIDNDIGILVSESDETCSTLPTTPTNILMSDNVIIKKDGITNTAAYYDNYNPNPYAGYQVGIADESNGDTIAGNQIISDNGAFGPQVSPTGAAFLAPIDIQSYPTINVEVHGNRLNGRPTRPPYPGEPGAP